MQENSDRKEKELEKATGEGKKEGVGEILKFVLIVAIIVIPFRLFIAQPYIVEGASMDQKFKDGDYLIVDQISTHFQELKRGDVVIMRYPNDPSKFFIKRVIGLPEETVSISKGKVYIKNSEGTERVALDEKYIVFEREEDFEATLKKSEYFVMGDNRAGSSDSRVWGPLPSENIVGRPILRLLPLQHIKFLPGQ